MTTLAEKNEAPTWRAYWDLTKPGVVALLMVTAVIGMFLATPGLPPLRTARAAVGTHLLDGPLQRRSGPASKTSATSTLRCCGWPAAISACAAAWCAKPCR